MENLNDEARLARLRPGQKAMSEEDWERHKDCDTAKRAHKWQWKLDIASGLPHPTAAICVHCGVERDLTRDYSANGASQ